MQTNQNLSPSTAKEAAELPLSRALIFCLANELQWDQATLERALSHAGYQTSRPDWLARCRLFFMLCGAALILAGVAAFFAFNWQDLHKFAKFALIQTGVVAGAWGAWRKGLDSVVGRCCLFAAAFLTGVHLAVYGQIYQTGADPYGLFIAWGVLAAAWVAIGRQPGLWMLAAVLANLSLILYWTQMLYPHSSWSEDFGGPLLMLGQMVWDQGLALSLLLLNGLVLVMWELCAERGVSWMQGRWFPRVIATGVLALMASASLSVIFDGWEHGARLAPLTPVGFVAVVGGCLWFYQRRRPDLLVLAECALAIILVVNSLIARLWADSFEFALFMALLVIGQTAFAALWLRELARKIRRGAPHE
ncbi:DUF2157 domain-containing protein [Hahella aquimaris]|uniref:DUF2157 domain-containing protein n=1 Tax=Hahella sp. HNIBRBA332 TaxID=3015983 RepID=UPI00273B1395|nr:DUF2157 domain-containing protein [Hahella sp. HNIBRBA332]WLQ12377.1 DUF2157 domain-containing protein [Hahella sp. HNIBRBA332]